MEPTSGAQREILSAALELLADAAPDAWFPSSRAVARRSHRARNTVANAFQPPGTHGLLRHLASSYALVGAAGRIALEDLSRRVELLIDMMADVDTERIPTLLQSLAQRHLSSLIDDRAGSRRRLVYTLAGSSATDDGHPNGPDEADRREFAKVVTEHYRDTSDRLITLYKELLASLNRTPRHPMDSERTMVALVAVTEGLQDRLLVDESLDTETAVVLFADVVSAIALAFTAPEGDDRTLEELFSDGFVEPVDGE